MAEQLDVYRDWLGIKETERPLSHYQLLRLEKFEDDTAKIRKNYRKMNAHVRKYATGKYAKESQNLLNELAKAMLTLTDERRKREYDASMGRADKKSRRKMSLEETLLARKIVTSEQLDKARNYADAVGLEVRNAVVQQKMTTADVVQQAYAESIGLPFLELSDFDLDAELVDRVPAVIARQHSCAPVMVDEGQLILASPNPLSPDVEDELRLRVGMPIRTAICTSAGINEVINTHYPKEKAQAEMAKGQGAPAAEAKDTSDDEDGGPRLSSAELNKRRGLVAFMAFNFGFVGTFAVCGFSTDWLLVSLLVAAGVAGVTYVGMIVTGN